MPIYNKDLRLWAEISSFAAKNLFDFLQEIADDKGVMIMGIKQFNYQTNAWPADCKPLTCNHNNAGRAFILKEE
jgi:predicted amino acid racemase